jgi:quercetin dioxygenase-like cupin family protein
VEIRRFGIGYRRKEGPAGTHGVEGQPIHADERGVIAELAFHPNAAIAPHTNPNLTYLVVIEGGGFVLVGDERARVAAGEAVVWPPDVVHAAWTEQTPMRALVVEFASPGREPLLLTDVPTVVELPAAGPVEAAQPVSTEPLRAARPLEDRDSPDREPW